VFNGNDYYQRVLRKSIIISLRKYVKDMRYIKIFFYFISLHIEFPDITEFEVNDGVAYWKRNYCEKS